MRIGARCYSIIACDETVPWFLLSNTKPICNPVPFGCLWNLWGWGCDIVILTDRRAGWRWS